MFYDLMIYLFMMILMIIFISLSYKYMLIMLISLEMLILTFSMIMYLILSMMNLEIFMIFYLVFMVCESVLGLTLLILIVRYYGNELYYVFNLMKF